MFKHSILLFIIGVIVAPELAHARPVSYPDGWTFMQNSDRYNHALHTHYSPTARQSIGYRYEASRNSDREFHGVQYNRLLKRYNSRASQANIYFKAALGVDSLPGLSQQQGGFVGISADWEDRRWFVSHDIRYDYGDHRDQITRYRSRLGIAPYIGAYGDVHTWLMLQNDYTGTEHIKSFVLRLFKGAYLSEFIVSEDDVFSTKFIIRF